MYSVSEDRPRGTPAGQSGREFPVLFHLMDVSRPRPKPTSAIDSANLLSAVEQLQWPPVDDSEPSPLAVAASQIASASIQQPVTADILSAREPEVVSPEISPSISTTIESAIALEAESAEAKATAEPSSTPPSSPPLVTLRKKGKASASEDWFAAHGKFIAVAFLLALGATIYFARVNRERASVAKQEPAAQLPLIETGPAIASTNQPSSKSATEAPTVQTVSVATLAPAGATSPVELRAPELVAGAATDKPKDNLFEFAATKAGDERIAARPDNAAKGAAPALTAPALTTPAASPSPEVIAATAPSAHAAAPGESTAYPVTSSPVTHYPVSIPPVTYPSTAYPTTAPTAGPPAMPAGPPPPVLAPPANSGYQPQSQYSQPSIYGNQYPVTPASLPQQPTAQAANAGQPTIYPSYDTTASGPRNERTGSGTY